MGDFFVRRPIVAMVIAIFMIIVGVVSLGGLPTEQYPNITPPIVEVRATYTGANAVSVEQSVATPLEQQINGVDNMIYMKSINANDGTMTIQVSFDVGHRSGHEHGIHPEPGGRGHGQAARRGQAPGGDHRKIHAQHPHVDLPDRGGPPLRSAVSGQLFADQHQGHPGPHQRHRPGECSGCQRLLHAHLDQARPPGPSGHFRSRDR